MSGAPLDLILIGFGNVARRFVRLLREREQRLAHEFGLSCRIAAIRTGSHGCALNAEGLDAGRALEIVERGESLDRLATGGICTTADEPARFIETACVAVSRPVVIETTPLDIRQGQPAIHHVLVALRAGADVITANKGPVAFACADLRLEAAARGRQFLFEGAVMDGVPLFNLVRHTLPAVQIVGFRGVLNSTTNYILSAMEDGRAFPDALAEMQASGIAEADATLDVDGWDAAAKTAALANALMDGRLTPQQIDRTGIAHVTAADVRAALDRGCRVKLVCSAERRDGRVAGRVGPMALAASDVLATLRGTQNALILDTDLLGEIVIGELTAGLTQTAYALLSDLIAVGTGARS